MTDLEKHIWAAAFAARSLTGGCPYDCAHAGEHAVAKFRELSESPGDRSLLFPCLTVWAESEDP